MSLAGLSLRDLEYLVAVAECRHFGQAAARCAVSQPSLSAQIRKLERFLGMDVFERTPGRVTVTPPGEAVVAQAHAVLREAQLLVEKARGHVNQLVGRFRIGAIPTLGPYLLPRALRPIRHAYPDLDLVFSEGRTEELLSALRRGELDGVLSCLPDNGEGLAIQPLFLEPFLLVHRPDHAPRWPLAEEGQPILVLDEGHCLRDQALSACGFGPWVAPRCATGVEMLRHMVAAGEGISLIPALAAQALGTLDGQIAYTSLDDTDLGRDVALVGRVSDPRMEHLPALAKLIQDAVGPALAWGRCCRARLENRPAPEKIKSLRLAGWRS
ncbi:LysR substrate-binding domain-containing protein [Pseudochelatococcus sp. B33]